MFSFDQITAAFPGFRYEAIDINGTPGAIVDRDQILSVAQMLRDEFGFRHIVDGLGIDRFERKMRFEMTYNLRNLDTKERVFLKVRCDERDPHLPSLTKIWGGTGWHEREAYDMYGIVFDGHADLRRMYMPEEYEHHPLRKDFPLTGVPGSIPLPVDTTFTDRLN
ncbi:MAG: NADH-quinone oxidoreductase subunit C [Bacteroidetes bacterium]|nr:NADH-quinone oxidoreductase subunit C [Bacteroidota bacterium]